LADDKHICPLFTAASGTEKKCLKESCVWWLLRDRNCAMPVLARSVRNIDEDGVDTFSSISPTPGGYVL